jgi:hypothetical protein
VARILARGMTAHEALRGLVAGTAAVTAGGTLVHVEDASADDAGSRTITAFVTARTAAATELRRADRLEVTASAWWTMRGSTSAPRSSSRLDPATIADRPTAPTVAVCRQWVAQITAPMDPTGTCSSALATSEASGPRRARQGQVPPKDPSFHAVSASIRPGHISAHRA